MTIDQIIDGILIREGGFVDHPADTGGATNFGITARTLGEWRHLGRPATDADVQALTEAEARAIYRAKYVDGPKLTAIADDRLRALLVDIAVNSGPVTAIRMLQQVCGVPVDGVLGPQTLGAAAARPSVVADLIRERAEFYLRLGLGGADVKAFLREHPKSQLHFLKGWMRRALEFTA
jgi:lysozyme family protein